jgi:Zn-dependent protease with chaperone function
MSLNKLMISVAMIKDRTPIHGNIDEKLIYPDIKVAQDMYIHPILGSALFNKLLTDIDGGTLAGDYKTLVDNFIVDALVWYTLMSLPQTLSYQFWNKGIVRKQGEDTETTMDELLDLSNTFRNRAEFYANRLKLYLKQEAPTKFPEYINPGNRLDDIHPLNKAFTLPVYLGDDECRPKSYEQMYQGNKPNCDCD